MAYLLDTNTVINYLGASLPKAGTELLNTIVDENPIVSVVTKIETLGYGFKFIEEQRIMEAFMNGSVVLHLSDDVVNKTIAIRKSKKIKLPDAIIAATALVHGLIIISRNTSDFKNIQGLQVIDPYGM